MNALLSTLSGKNKDDLWKNQALLSDIKNRTIGVEILEILMSRVIVCAACRDRKTGQIILGVRHWDELMFQTLDKEADAEEFDDEQGFVDNKYQFVTRTDAWKVAESAGQIKRRCGGDTRNGGTLYSENLY